MVGQNGTGTAAALSSLALPSDRSKPRASSNTAPESAAYASPKYIVPFGSSRVRFHISPFSGHSDERLPFFLVLHGLGGSGEQLTRDLHLDAIAQQRPLMYAAPDGEFDRQGRRFWDAGPCCNFFNIPSDDVSRLDALIDHAVTTLGADPRQIYVIGFSNGGMMAHRIACTGSRPVRAIISVSAFGPSNTKECPTARAVAVLEIHGDRDSVVPFNGGRLFGNPSLPETPSVMTGLRSWADRNACDGQLLPTARLDLDSDLPGSETQVFNYRSCARAPVMLWKVEGGAHALGLGARSWDGIWGFITAAINPRLN